MCRKNIYKYLTSSNDLPMIFFYTFANCKTINFITNIIHLKKKKMKKSILMIAVSAILVVFTTSCEKDKTDAEILYSAKNGWTITAATSSPAYPLMLDGADISVVDLFQGFIKDCELDDYYKFEESGALKLNPGKDKVTVTEAAGWKCGDASEISLGNWKLDNDEEATKFTYFYLPYFEDNMTNNTIVDLSNDKIIVSVTFNEEGVKYTFTLTYTKN